MQLGLWKPGHTEGSHIDKLTFRLVIFQAEVDNSVDTNMHAIARQLDNWGTEERQGQTNLVMAPVHMEL